VILLARLASLHHLRKTFGPNGSAPRTCAFGQPPPACGAESKRDAGATQTSISSSLMFNGSRQLKNTRDDR
jgi:hypothetical protein